MPDDTILCWTWPNALKPPRPPDKHLRVLHCTKWLKEGEAGRHKLAEFFRQRITERYIDPVRQIGSGDRNGFPIMAISCLLIETFESFRQGWESTEGRGRCSLAFCYFFDTEEAFGCFKGHSQEFYKCVRCGILHQGETTGGWTIRRDGVLFDRKQKRVNATLFHQELEKAVGTKVQATEKWALRVDDEDPDKQTLTFDYPSSFAPDTTGYIRRVVKIEMGARADHWRHSRWAPCLR